MERLKLSHALPSTIATGGHLKNTVCVTNNDEAFISPVIGDLDNVASIEKFHEELNKLIDFLNVTPQCIAHDMHPDFYATHFAKEFGVPNFPIQHHHAHLAAVIAEYHIDTPALGLALDGYGYGNDGGAWGGELMLLENQDCKRLGHLAELAMPGGDRASKEPWRMAASVLHHLGYEDEIQKRFTKIEHASSINDVLSKKINSPMTSSCGRLFDAASALLGIQFINQHEAQAAMEMEALVDSPSILNNAWEISEDTLSLLPLMHALMHLSPKEGAELFHGTLAFALGNWLKTWSEKLNVTTVLLSGGCFLNKILTQCLITHLKQFGLSSFLPKQLPPHDGGLSLGQAWIAGNRFACV